MVEEEEPTAPMEDDEQPQPGTSASHTENSAFIERMIKKIDEEYNLIYNKELEYIDQFRWDMVQQKLPMDISECHEKQK